MKNKSRILALTVSLCIVLSLLVQIFLPLVSFADDGVIHIKNAEDFLEFAKDCSYDAWSEGKSVILESDISLEGLDFDPIATFSGSFDGGGHTISGLNVTGAYAPAGLFVSLKDGAVIKNLTVKGTVTPTGDKGVIGGIVGDNCGEILNCVFVGTIIGKSDVGGIVGINRIGGRVSECRARGEILGENRTGGIVGSNDGLISSCKNEAKINTIGVTPSLSLEDINVSLTLDITKLPSLNNSTMSDTGGIAGYSTGIIMGSENFTPVGYPHIGYNVGGIVGRSNGHLIGNVNYATINGRKDVGGIVGQMEPHISYELSEDLLASLKAELDDMNDAVNSAVGSAGSGIPNVSSRLDSLINDLDLATNSLNDLINGVGGYGEDMLDEVNRIGLVLDEVISQLSSITDAIPELSGYLNGSLTELESLIVNIKDFTSINSETISNLANASNSIASAFENIGLVTSNLNAAITAFEGALTVGDKAAAEDSINKISDNLSAFITSTDSLADALEEVTVILDSAAWTDDAVEQINALITVFGEISSSVSAIYDAIDTVKENVDIYWDKFAEAKDELIVSLGHITDMTVSLAEAMELISQGVGEMSEGFKLLDESINLNNPDDVKSALDTIVEGVKQMAAGTSLMSEALDELSAVMEEIDSISELEKLFTEGAESTEKLADAVGEMSDSVTKLADGLAVIVENLEVDFDGVEGGGALIIGGMDKLVESMPHITDSIVSLSSAMIALENAINALDEGIDVKDEDKVSEALNQAYTAIGEIIDSTTTLSDIFTEIGVTLGNAKIWGDELTNAIKGVSVAFSDMTEALKTAQSGIDELRENISFDLENAEDGLGLIKDALSAFDAASGDLNDCFDSIASVLEGIDSGSEALDGAMTDLKECISEFKKVTTSISSISEDIGLLIGYLKGVDPIQFPTPPESITAKANELFMHISAVENDLKLLNASITDLGGELVESVGKINEIFNNISDNLVSIIYGLNSGESIDKNVSEEEIDSVTNGKVFSCTNKGDIHGDVNVGGISGAMGIEYALDPEDDLTSELTVTQKKQYKFKAVIHASKNYGSVTSKKDCVGGIVGKMDIGLVYGCESYSEITSQTGNYVGGIAGITAGLISQSFTKGVLSGGKYVGGIVGSGVKEDLSGDSSMVRNCYSMVRIDRYTQYAGAISGIGAGQFSENLFISDTLSGIDRVSYKGKAEPILYEELIKRRSIPDEFYSFVIKFIVDGKVIYSTEYGYGDSFDSSIFPDIPEKEGHYGYWDRITLTSLVFDTEVHAVYVPYVKAIGSEEKRDGGREIFFVRGEFTENDIITVSKGKNIIGLALEEKFFTKDSLVESWVLTIPRDTLETNTVHFLPENEHARIFIKVNDTWQEAKTSEFGSYLTFEVNQDIVEIAVLEHEIKSTPVIIIGVSGLLLLVMIIVICIISKKKKKAKSGKTEKEKANISKSEAEKENA